MTKEDRNGGIEMTPEVRQALIRSKIRSMEQVRPMTSSDGYVALVGKDVPQADKLVLLNFAQDVRERLEGLLGIELANAKNAILIRFIKSEKGDRPGVRYDSRKRANYPVRIVVRDVDALDPREFASALCKAWLRSDAIANGYEDRAGAKARDGHCWSAPYPWWFGYGIARTLEVDARQDDIDAVFRRWEWAALPCVEKVLTRRWRDPKAEPPSYSDVLVMWMLDAPSKAGRFAKIREAAISSGWSNASIAKAMGKETAVDLDSDFDRWMAGRKGFVATVGKTTPAMYGWLRNATEIHPGSPALPLTEAPLGESLLPINAVERRNEAWMKAAAGQKAAEIRKLGLGRGEDFRKCIEAWAHFFDGVAERRSSRELVKRLEAANALMPPGLL